MPVSWPGSDVPESATRLRPALWKMKIEKGEETASKGGKYMIVVTLRSVLPAKGLPYKQMFCIGTDKDPKAKDPKTWTDGNFAASQFVKFLKRAGVPIVKNMKAQLASLKGKSIGMDIVVQIDDGKRDPKYKGRKRNDCTEFYTVGEFKPHYNDEDEPDIDEDDDPEAETDTDADEGEDEDDESETEDEDEDLDEDSEDDDEGESEESEDEDESDDDDDDDEPKKSKKGAKRPSGGKRK